MKETKIINIDGDTYYFMNGMIHRDGGPAIEWADGGKSWYKNGKLHREDGPAFERCNGDKEWYKSGGLHREEGPAVECVCGYKEWWSNDKRYGKNNDFNNESWQVFIKTLIFS